MCDVSRESGTDSTNGGCVQRLVMLRLHVLLFLLAHVFTEKLFKQGNVCTVNRMTSSAVKQQAKNSETLHHSWSNNL